MAGSKLDWAIALARWKACGRHCVTRLHIIHEDGCRLSAVMSFRVAEWRERECPSGQPVPSVFPKIRATAL